VNTSLPRQLTRLFVWGVALGAGKEVGHILILTSVRVSRMIREQKKLGIRSVMTDEERTATTETPTEAK